MVLSRGLAPLLLLTLAASPLAAQESVPDPAWLRLELDIFRVRAGLPAVGATVVLHDRVVAASAVGARRHGAAGSIRPDDPFHLGSVAKMVSATLFGRLVDQGVLRWDMTLQEMFPTLVPTMRPEYRTVTVTQLLSHTSGMPYEPRTPEVETDKQGATARERRRGYVLAALRDAPEAPPGSKTIYGGGHMIVAHYVEEALRTPFETLMQERVFRPLGLSSARYGSPASAMSSDGPREHVMEGGQPKALGPSCGQEAQARSPAGRNLCMSMADLGRFVAVHLAGAHGRSDFLKPSTFASLQNARPPLNVSSGWLLGSGNWARGKLLWHSGSTGRNMALCHIAPEEDFAICVATNIGFEGAHGRMDELTQKLARLIQSGKFGTR